MSGDELAKSKHLWLMRRKRLRFSIGNCFLQLQDILQATRTFEGILREEPHNLRLRSGLGRLALHLGDLRTASRRFAQVAEQVGDAAESSAMVQSNNALYAFATSREKGGFFWLCTGHDKRKKICDWKVAS